jgi:hypothetical protein
LVGRICGVALQPVELIGFAKESKNLYAIVKQSFVTITQETDLNKVRCKTI